MGNGRAFCFNKYDHCCKYVLGVVLPLNPLSYILKHHWLNLLNLTYGRACDVRLCVACCALFARVRILPKNGKVIGFRNVVTENCDIVGLQLYS